MAFVRNRPTATEVQSTTQPLLFNNFNSSDDSFGVDHYAFSDTTANNGFHNTVTQPLIKIVAPATNPAHPTTTTNPIIYAMQDSTNIGTIQYSRGPVFNSYVPSPTPVTRIYSPSTPLSITGMSTLNVLDCAGLSYLLGTLWIYEVSSTQTSVNFLTRCDFIFNSASGSPPGPVFAFVYSSSLSPSTPILIPSSSGTILQIKNVTNTTYNSVYWALQLDRINT